MDGSGAGRPAGGAAGSEGVGDAAALRAHADALAEALVAALPGWVERCVHTRCEQAGVAITPSIHGATAEAGRRCADDVGGRVRILLATDVDDQRTTPLSLVREGVRYPAAVLRSAGVPEVVRDEFAERSFPDDVYDLAPATLADVSPELHEPGLVWGAAKAHVHLRRHR
jgi:hypothetical protein